MNAATQASIREFAAQRHFRPSTIERWLALAAADAQALLDLATDLRLGENQLGDLWVWAEEIAARDGRSLADVFGNAAVLDARRRKVSRNDRLKLTKEALRRLRYPQLAATEDRLLALLRRLNLPRIVQVSLPGSLEGDSLAIRFEVGSPGALKQIASELSRAADSAACAELFALLEEAG